MTNKRMKIELFFTYAGLTEEDVRGKTVVVIDVLRACTTACAAFRSGCREIIPVESIGDATSLLANLDRDVVLLAGERQGYKVDGFDLGNSPYEFTEDIVRGKVIILASTNGSRALVPGSGGEECMAASFVNVSNVVERIASVGNDIAIVCSGRELHFSLEDTLCGGMIISGLADRAESANDAAVVALALYEERKSSLASALRNSDHGRYLVSLGFSADIDFAAQVDSIGLIPYWDNGRLVVDDGA